MVLINAQSRAHYANVRAETAVYCTRMDVDDLFQLCATGIQDCPRVLRRGRRFCGGSLLPEVPSSEAARQVKSFLAS